MYHYVYLLTHKETGLMYIGARTSKVPPDEDTAYMSSSSMGKAYCTNCKKEILKQFEKREDAILYEVKLHNVFDVAVNQAFFNKSKQTTKAFDTGGTTAYFSKTHRENLSKAAKGKRKPHYRNGGNPAAKKVECVTTGKVFNTIKQAAEYYGIKSSSNVSRACRGAIPSSGKNKETGESLKWRYINND